MTITKGRIAGAALTAAAAIAVLSGTTATASTTDTLMFGVINDQFAATDAGPVGPSVGDEYVYSDDLTVDGAVVGDDAGFCQVTHIEGDVQTTQCVHTLRLPDGQLTAQAVWDRGSSDPLVMAVTGGTGAYAGVGGELVATDIQTPQERYTITLQR